MNRNNVLFILHLPPPIHGASIMGKYVMSSNILNNTFNCDYINLSTSNTVDEIGKYNYKKVFSFFKLYINIINKLIKNKYDLVYITINSKGSGFYKEIIIVFILNILKIPFVSHYHNKGVLENSKKWYNNILYKIQFKKSKVILLSKLLKHDIEKYVNDNDIYYCSNGIQNVSKKSINNNFGEPFRILFLSNLIESKGLFILLEACKIIKEKKLNFKLLIAGAEGDITITDFNFKIKELEIDNYAEYVGPKYGTEKNKLFETSDIFVFPTFYKNETFGLVNLEAMQHSLPVISTNEGAIPEIVEDGVTGYIIPRKDAKALADKLEYLIKNRDIATEMGKKGYEKYINSYTLEIFENNFTNTLDQIIKDFKQR